jgi:putative solute:sodium symporter small subunit
MLAHSSSGSSSAIVHMFVNVLNQLTVPSSNSARLLAAQGSLIVFVVMLFVFAWQQDRIDRQHGVAGRLRGTDTIPNRRRRTTFHQEP